MIGPTAKTLGACGPSGFGLGTSRGTPFTMIHPRLFHTFSLFCHPGRVKRDLFHWRQTQPVPRESIGHYTGLGQGILLELNPNILVRDEERMLGEQAPNSYPLFCRANPLDSKPPLSHPTRIQLFSFHHLYHLFDTPSITPTPTSLPSIVSITPTHSSRQSFCLHLLFSFPTYTTSPILSPL